jgi:hypothetical protein
MLEFDASHLLGSLKLKSSKAQTQARTNEISRSRQRPAQTSMVEGLQAREILETLREVLEGISAINFAFMSIQRDRDHKTKDNLI